MLSLLQQADSQVDEKTEISVQGFSLHVSCVQKIYFGRAGGGDHGVSSPVASGPMSF